MHITFGIPYYLSPGSSPDENAFVRDTVVGCVKELRQGSASREAQSFRGPGPTEVTFDVCSAFLPGSSLKENAHALEVLLRCLCCLNLDYLKRRGLRSYNGLVTPLYDSPIYYDRTIVWDTIPALAARGFGDCKSLTGQLIAEYRYRGIAANPVFRFVPPEKSDNGQFKYHILVVTTRAFEDPSKVKGMGANEVASIQQNQSRVSGWR